MTKPHYRVSATQLVALQYYLNDIKSEEDFIEQIQGGFTGNERTKAGTFVHDIIEKGIIIGGKYNIDDANGQLIKLMYNIDKTFPFEQKETQVYELNDYNITLVTKFDQWAGYQINEHKTKYNKFDYDTYETSMQWRAYLLNTGADLVRYKVLECDLKSMPTTKKEKELYKNDLPIIKIKELHEFNLYNYPALKDEVLNFTQEFIRVATQLELLQFLSNKSRRI